MSYENVKLDKDGPVARITIDRPDKMNALNHQTLVELDHAIDDVAGDDALRAVIVTGSGDKAFVAGADIGELLAVAGDAIWVTLVGRNELARVSDNEVELFPTGGSPHDLIVGPNGLIWFSSWGSRVLHIFDPATGTTAEAPAGVTEPHHFAIAPDGTVWLSDNGGAAIVGFATQPVTVDVGPIPHHLGFVGDTIVVAVSGTGEAVLIRDGQVVASSQLTTGLHGVAAVELTQPPNIAAR